MFFTSEVGVSGVGDILASGVVTSMTFFFSIGVLGSRFFSTGVLVSF